MRSESEIRDLREAAERGLEDAVESARVSGDPRPTATGFSALVVKEVLDWILEETGNSVSGATLNKMVQFVRGHRDKN